MELARREAVSADPRALPRRATAAPRNDSLPQVTQLAQRDREHRQVRRRAALQLGEQPLRALERRRVRACHSAISASGVASTSACAQHFGRERALQPREVVAHRVLREALPVAVGRELADALAQPRKVEHRGDREVHARDRFDRLAVARSELDDVER